MSRILVILAAMMWLFSNSLIFVGIARLADPEATSYWIATQTIVALYAIAAGVWRKRG